MRHGFRIFLEIIVCSLSNIHYLIDSSMAFFPAVLHVPVKTPAAAVLPIKLCLIMEHAPCNCVHSATARVCLGDMTDPITVGPVKTIGAELIHLLNEWYQKTLHVRLLGAKPKTHKGILFIHSLKGSSLIITFNSHTLYSEE